MAAKGTTGSSPLYDAFVVRLWREAATGRVLRAEVEHAPTGALARAAGVSTAWVLSQISARLATGPPTGGATGDGVGLTPDPPASPHPRSRDRG
jgi:hypothetical protein